MDLNRRHFLFTTSAASLVTIGGKVFAEDHFATHLASWPTKKALFDGLLNPLDVSVPPLGEMFGSDEHFPQMWAEGTSSLPGETLPAGRSHAAFLFLRGPSRARSGGRAMPWMHPKKHTADVASLFYRGLLWKEAPAISMMGKLKCPWCGESFGGLRVLDGEDYPLRTSCCGKEVGPSAALPAQVPGFVMKQEIAYARWQYLLLQLSGMIALVLQEKIGEKPHPFARLLLKELVLALPEYLDGQPWVSPSTGARVTLADFPEGTLPESAGEQPETAQPGKEEIEHFIEAVRKAPMGSIPTENGVHSIVQTWQHGALLAEAFATISGGLTEKQQESIRASLSRQCCLLRHKPHPTGNFPGYTMPYTLSVAIGCRDEALYQDLLAYWQHYLHNHFYDDGLSVEGAFNYAVMLQALYLPGLRNRLGKTVWAKMVARRPLLGCFTELTSYPVRTLHGIESQHADEHLGYFKSVNLLPVEEPDYEKHEDCQVFPAYGIGCLRAGKPGQRVEAIMDFRSSVLHTHASRLNVQLFFEGVSLMPELGYAAHSGLVDPDDVPKEIRERMPLRKMRPWFPNAVEMHCAPTIDGHQGDSPHGNLQGWFGKGGLEEAGAGLRFMDVILPRECFAKYPGDIRLCSRQWMTVTLPDGTAVSVSICRMRGGQRHDNWWHFPAPATKPSAAVRKTAENLYDYLQKAVATPPPYARELSSRVGSFSLKKDLHGDNSLVYGEDSRELKKVRAWQGRGKLPVMHRWLITPAAYVLDYEREPEPWLKPIEVRLWSAQHGSPAGHRYISSRAPWPAMMRLEKYRNGLVCRDDALDVFTEERYRVGDRPLESAFVNVLTARIPDEKAHDSVRVVHTFENDLAYAPHLANGVEVGYGKNELCTIMSTNSGSTRFQNKERNAALHGRVGKVCPQALEVVLSDGESLRAQGFELKIDGGWSLPLAGLVGDLTGQPDQSALIVETDDPLPDTLIGTRLFVEHRSSPAHESCYEISGLSQTKDGKQRIDLAGHPPFALANFRLIFRGGNWVEVYKNQRFAPARSASTGRLVYFPSVDFSARILHAVPRGSGRWTSSSFQFDRALPATIKPGDAMICYSIQPGDRVRIPSSFACRKVGKSLAIESTGRAELTIPGQVNFAKLPGDVQIKIEGETKQIVVPAGKFKLPLKD